MSSESQLKLPETDGGERVMIYFQVGNGDEQFFEGMHATAVAEGGYLIDNSPFYAYGVSFKDIVAAGLSEGRLVFTGVVRRGGHSTYRVRLPEGRDHEFFLQHWTEFEKLGCTYEGSSSHRQRLYAIDVPAPVSVQEVYDVLERGEQHGWWEFEEAHYCSSAQHGKT